MDINSPEFAHYIDQIVEQKVLQIVPQILEKYGNLRAWDAIVTSVNGNLASVKLVGFNTEIPNLKNKSGQTLVVNEEVYLHSPSTIKNAYIAICKNKPT